MLTCPGVPALSAPASGGPARKGRVWHRLVLGLVIVFLLLLAPLVYGGVFAATAAYRLESLQSSIAARFAQGDLVGVGQDLQDVNEAVADIQSGLAMTSFWRSVPWIGPRLMALDRVTQIGHALLEGVERALVAATSVQAAVDATGSITNPSALGIAPHRSFRDLSVEEKRTVLARASQSLTDIRIAREKIAIALDLWSRIPQDDLVAPVRSRLAPLMERLTSVRVTLDEVLSLADVLMPFTGYPKEKTYLVLLQNADELRPTGGFIGTIGLVKVEAGELKQVDFQDVYAIDGPVQNVWKDVPPEILRRELGVKAWFLRDRNWSPDFPTTAVDVMDTFRREYELATSVPAPHLDGVLAFEPAFFQNMLRFIGPLTVEGKTFTADNFFDQLEYDVEIGYHGQGIPMRQRKEIVSKVGDVLIETLMNQPASRWPELLNVVWTSLERKDILLYDRDPALLARLDDRNWTGRARSSSEDFVWVVDANLAALKTDGVMDKKILYQVDASQSSDPLGPLATVTLTYRNTNRVIDWRRTRYRSYTRVYVPEGSELVSSDGAMANDLLKTGGTFIAGPVDVTRELGKTVFGAFWSIEPGTTRTLSFTYRLPVTLGQDDEEGMYRLLVQKQPGTNTQLTLDLSFDKKLSDAVPPEASNQFGDTRYRVETPLDTDKMFNVSF